MFVTTDPTGAAAEAAIELIADFGTAHREGTEVRPPGEASERTEQVPVGSLSESSGRWPAELNELPLCESHRWHRLDRLADG